MSESSRIGKLPLGGVSLFRGGRPPQTVQRDQREGGGRRLEALHGRGGVKAGTGLLEQVVQSVPRHANAVGNALGFQRSGLGCAETAAQQGLPVQKFVTGPQGLVRGTLPRLHVQQRDAFAQGGLARGKRRLAAAEDQQGIGALRPQQVAKLCFRGARPQRAQRGRRGQRVADGRGQDLKEQAAPRAVGLGQTGDGGGYAVMGARGGKQGDMHGVSSRNGLRGVCALSRRLARPGPDASPCARWDKAASPPPRIDTILPEA